MPIYEYESIPTNEGDPVERYELRQRMSDEPYTRHPESGIPVRRVYSAFAVGSSSSADSCGCEGASCESGHKHGGGCCCGCCGM